jgi:hypothetical protein
MIHTIMTHLKRSRRAHLSVFAQGKAAANDRLSIDDNPYIPIFDPHHYRDWRAGFVSACDEEPRRNSVSPSSVAREN